MYQVTCQEGTVLRNIDFHIQLSGFVPYTYTPHAAISQAHACTMHVTGLGLEAVLLTWHVGQNVR